MVAKSGPQNLLSVMRVARNIFSQPPTPINCHCLYVHLAVPAGSKYEKWVSTGFGFYQKLEVGGKSKFHSVCVRAGEGPFIGDDFEIFDSCRFNNLRMLKFALPVVIVVTIVVSLLISYLFFLPYF